MSETIKTPTVETLSSALCDRVATLEQENRRLRAFADQILECSDDEILSQLPSLNEHGHTSGYREERENYLREVFSNARAALASPPPGKGGAK